MSQRKTQKLLQQYTKLFINSILAVDIKFKEFTSNQDSLMFIIAIVLIYSDIDWLISMKYFFFLIGLEQFFPHFKYKTITF